MTGQKLSDCFEPGRQAYIYGAGKVGRAVLRELQLGGVKAAAFLVTGKEGNGDVIDGIPVCCIDEADIGKGGIVIAAVSGKFMEEVTRTLEEKGIDRYIRYTGDFYRELRRGYLMSRLEREYFIDETYAVEGSYCGIGKKSDTECTYHFRIHMGEQIYAEMAAETDLLRDFERCYGKYHLLPAEKAAQGNTYRILMACCHKDKKPAPGELPGYVTPIQCGKALTDIKICDVTDDTGDNISARNGNYCECTALYWAWKNRWGTDADYIGLCHYRRQMKLTEGQIGSLAALEFDMALTAPTYIPNIREHFSACTKNAQDWDILREAVEKVCPEYREAFVEYEGQHMACQCNMFIMRRALFDEYCGFLFPVLQYVEDYYAGKAERNDRYLGYLAESLLSVFAMKNKERLKTAYVDMLCI